MKYLITFQPLKPYTFVDEQDSYKIRSADLPSQSTVLGTLRYLILKNAGVLKTSYKYTKNEKAKMDELIGPEGFSFGMHSCFKGYGVIKNISPVFLLDKDQNILIRNPFCNLSHDGYLPLKLGKRVETSWGEMFLPEPGQNLGRTGHGEGYLRLSDMKVISEEEIFICSYDVASEASGQRKQKNEYFKREKRMLKAGYSIAVFAELEEKKAFQHIMSQGLCFIGKKSAVFSMNAVVFDAVQEKILEKEASLRGYLERVFKEYIADVIEKTGMTRKLVGQFKQTWYYALSDIYVGDADTFSMYAIAEVKRDHVLSAGTVFSQKPDIPQDGYLVAAGYNAVIQIGG